jgi:peptide chain release factor 1
VNREELDKKLARFEELDRQLLDPAVLADGHRAALIARERGEVAKLAVKYRRFKDVNRELTEALAMASGPDAEMREIAAEEATRLRTEREQVWNELLDLTVGGEDANRSKCMLEIRAGTGGDEAALFARDLYEMYRRYAETKGWKFEIMDLTPSDLGGFKELILGVDGEGSFRELQYESGGHRVQRVPETETKGRIHTSLATVAVMPEPDDVEVDIKPEDYRLDLYCASGPGGQHVNKTQSAVRLTHYETGIVVQCQDEKSQHKNKARALRVLKSRIYEHLRAKEQAKRSDQRRTLVGSGDRSERIRTYNFPQGRMTDHRINLTLYALPQIMDGDLGPVIDALVAHDQAAKLAEAEA